MLVGAEVGEVNMNAGRLPFPFPAAGPYPDPADPSGDTLSITLWITPDAEEVQASYQRAVRSWRLSALCLVAEGQRHSFAPDDLAVNAGGRAVRLRTIMGRAGLEPPQELRLS